MMLDTYSNEKVYYLPHSLGFGLGQKCALAWSTVSFPSSREPCCFGTFLSHTVDNAVMYELTLMLVDLLNARS